MGKLTLFHCGCLMLTCVVVHTCARIEVLNARYGYYLPRQDLAGGGNKKWRLAAERVVRLDHERQIAMQRQNDFQAAHPDREVPDLSEFQGPPYTEAEDAVLDAETRQNRLRSALRRWVAGMGLLQYLLAPIALLWSLKIVFTERLWRVRAMAVCCGTASIVCIALMFYRGYFTSLGW